MLVITLNPHIDYYRATAIAKHAHKEGLTLREAFLASGFVSTEDFERWVVPLDMTHPRVTRNLLHLHGGRLD